jgi:undecaprenyl-diphosphatase
MPSLHAANAFAFALLIALQWPAFGIPSLALAFLIGISRIYVGVHWPSDVVAGALWGSAVSLLIWWARLRGVDSAGQAIREVRGANGDKPRE